MTADRGTRFYGPIAELDLGQARTVTLPIPRIVGPADVAAPPCTWR
jgi:hypothetical protein